MIKDKHILKQYPQKIVFLPNRVLGGPQYNDFLYCLAPLI